MKRENETLDFIVHTQHAVHQTVFELSWSTETEPAVTFIFTDSAQTFTHALTRSYVLYQLLRAVGPAEL